MDRRGFLAGIFATATAPAIVRAESLMKIWVPEQKIITGQEIMAKYHNMSLEEIVTATILAHKEEIVRNICTHNSFFRSFRDTII